MITISKKAGLLTAINVFTVEPEQQQSSVPGIFVAGDVRHGSVKRVATGVGEGAIAVQFLHQYLSL